MLLEPKQNMAEATDEEIAEAFEMLSDDGGTIDSKCVGDLCRELGHSPSLKEINTFLEKVGSRCDIKAFKKFYLHVHHSEDDLNDLLQLFLFYDTQNIGKIDKTVFSKIMQTFGEPLSDEEMKIFMKDIVGEEEMVDYKQVITKLLNK